ncbi:MAG: hypothetical protein ACRDIV_14855 [Ktedonobacteraceae bacterium]
MTGYDSSQQAGEEDVSVLQELDLGCYTLFLMSDGSIDLLANDSETPYLAENAFHLDSDETYRLFISLHEQYKEQQARLNEERITGEQGRGGDHATGRTACHRLVRPAPRRD